SSRRRRGRDRQRAGAGDLRQDDAAGRGGESGATVRGVSSDSGAWSMVSVPMRTAGLPALRWLLIGVPLLALIGQLWPIMHDLWMTNSSYSHGYLVLGLAAWLAVREYRREPLTGARPSWAGLALLGLIAAGVFVARA